MDVYFRLQSKHKLSSQSLFGWSRLSASSFLTDSFALHSCQILSLELALCMSFSKFFDIHFLINPMDCNPRFAIELTPFPRSYDRIDLLLFVQSRLLQNCAEEIERYTIFVQINYQFQDHCQSAHTNRVRFYQNVLSSHLGFLNHIASHYFPR